MSYDPPPHDVSPHAFPPHDSHDFSPPYSTYPWQPATPPEPPAQRHRHRAALGHHSDLRILRSAYRWQRRTATLAALGYFTLFLVLSAFAPAFMSGEVVDGLPTGLLLALVQLPVTWLAVGLYEHTAHRYVDPIADRIRRESELNVKREGAGRR